MTPCSASSDRRRCGPDCQRRVSWLGRPPSPRTLTAKPSLTPRLRIDGAAGPRAPVVRLVVVLAAGSRRVAIRRWLRRRGGRRQEALLRGSGRLGLRRGGGRRLRRRRLRGGRLGLRGGGGRLGLCGGGRRPRLRHGRRRRAGRRGILGRLVAARRHALERLAGEGLVGRLDGVLDLMCRAAHAGVPVRRVLLQVGLRLLLALRLAAAGLGHGTELVVGGLVERLARVLRRRAADVGGLGRGGGFLGGLVDPRRRLGGRIGLRVGGRNGRRRVRHRPGGGGAVSAPPAREGSSPATFSRLSSAAAPAATTAPPTSRSLPRDRFEVLACERSLASAIAASASARLRAVLPLRLNGAIAIYSSKVRRQMRICTLDGTRPRVQETVKAPVDRKRARAPEPRTRRPGSPRAGRSRSPPGR